MLSRAIFLLMLTGGVAVCAGAQSQNACASLATAKLDDIVISSSTEINPSPAWNYPVSAPGHPIVVTTPFCRVVGNVRGNIGFEVWLPITGWNHHLLSSGNGAYAGFINAGFMAGALKRGYATASTDTGHRGSPMDSDWARNPELIKDFGYEGHHQLAIAAKKIVTAFYGAAPRRSLFVGCSGGGHEAMAEAERFPADYDGIIAGAAGIRFPGLAIRSFYMYWATQKIPGGSIPLDKAKMVQQAVVKSCDAQDGLVDGLLSKPMMCKFYYSSLQCPAGEDNAKCLTAPQVQAVQILASDVKTSTGTVVYPEFAPGALLRDPAIPPATGQVGLGFMRNFLFNNPEWPMTNFNLDEDYSLAEKKVGPALDANNPDLKPFKDRGGKLIMYHGWADDAVSPLTSVQYFDAVRGKLGGDVEDSFFRLYMVPGMAHCREGNGPNQFGSALDIANGAAPGDQDHDLLSALEGWIDSGNAPQQIIATRVENDKPEFTRPLCPYPQVAMYSGKGDTKDAASFRCEKP
jgi:feruloyl esterase